jgi:hypothetical protein
LIGGRSVTAIALVRSFESAFSTNPTLFGDLVWLAFVVAQVADGSLTYIGVKIHGPTVEANPLLVWYMTASGTTLAIVGAKLFALLCGALLHLRAMHRVIAILTGLYLGLSIGPWTIFLWHSL